MEVWVLSDGEDHYGIGSTLGVFESKEAAQTAGRAWLALVQSHIEPLTEWQPPDEGAREAWLWYYRGVDRGVYLSVAAWTIGEPMWAAH